jgi:acetolactate synthase-1/2/3 large subunit
MLDKAKRPVICLGHGVRAAGVDPAPLLDLGIPILSSWAAKDLVDNFHPNYFGSPGQYGQRMANKIFYEADLIIAIGNRLSIWFAGYAGPRADQQLIMVDCDENEVSKFPQAVQEKQGIAEFVSSLTRQAVGSSPEWLGQCHAFRAYFPLVESSHADTRYINSYRFTEALQEYLTPTQIIVTDCGAVMCPAFQVLRLKPPQRILTSGGLGEMGCGLPAAIGASFATDKGPVLCLVGDGGIMLNLQELQTIVHHKLPIKIIVYENDGYGMIKKTQDAAGFARGFVSKQNGVSIPNLRAVAHAFGLAACDLFTWDDFNRAIPALFAATGPSLVVYHMDPEQAYYPKLDPIYVGGKPTSPRFDQMSPQI